jgi:hypothetical protein
LETAGLSEAKRFRKDGSLVLVARAGFFIPKGNDHRHRGTTLLGLLIAGAGGADVMLKGRGHCGEAVLDAAYCSHRAKLIFFVMVKIA